MAGKEIIRLKHLFPWHNLNQENRFEFSNRLFFNPNLSNSKKEMGVSVISLISALIIIPDIKFQKFPNATSLGNSQL